MFKNIFKKNDKISEEDKLTELLEDAKENNQLIFSQLKASGDTLTKERPVIFYIYFEENNDLLSFLTEVSEFESDLSYSEEDMVAIIEKNIVPSLEYLDNYIADLLKYVIKYNGEYDGWETELIK